MLLLFEKPPGIGRNRRCRCTVAAMLKRLLPVVALVLVATGCSNGDDAAGPSQSAVTTQVGAPTTAVPACSGAREPNPEPIPADVTSAVEATRSALIRAARTCDWDALDRLAQSEEFSYTFGVEADSPSVRWREQEASGEPVTQILERLLAETPAGEVGTMSVWPSVHNWSVDRLTAPPAGDLSVARTVEDILGRPLAETTHGGVGYSGWRVGIDQDGTWAYFIAGD